MTSLGSTLNLLVVFSLSFFNLIDAFNLTSTGSTVELNGIPYYIPGRPYASLPNFNSQILAGVKGLLGGLVPVTVIGAASVNFDVRALETTIVDFGEKDDVWGEGFLSAIFIQYSSKIRKGPINALTSPAILGKAKVPSILSVLPSKSLIPSGPYFISSDGGLYQPYRLYSDIAGAFTQALIPAETENFYSPLPATLPGIASPGVAVPSRLYYTKTADKPLAGVRTGIKDIYDVAGVKTSDGNRAFYALYPPRTKNAVVVQRLIDAGAVLVGKVKTSQFANGEQATEDWVDYLSPFNPRGDGYQDPSSSSSGSGAASGSYAWLDLTLGSDTGGSVRGPAQVQGLYGNRPTHGIVPLTGVMPLAPQLDTPGFLSRDPTIWASAGKVLYEGLSFSFTEYPKKIHTINFPTPSVVSTDPVKVQSDAIVLDFLAKLEGFLSTKATPLNYTNLWDQTKPDPKLDSLNIFFNRTYPTFISKEQTKNVRDPFYADYAARYDGRRPFVNPVPLVRWAFGDSLPASELDAAVANKTIFKNWWEANIIANDSVTCSDSLILYTSGVNILYRNKFTGVPTPPFGFGDDQITIFTGIPDFVFPLGQAAYNSSITLHSEFLPVSVDIMAARGCDGLIFQLVEDLYRAGIVEATQAGRTIKGGEILLKRTI